jgi:hypothetical protein
MTSERLGEMFIGDSADTHAGYFFYSNHYLFIGESKLYI